jgi:hypothetical protein
MNTNVPFDATLLLPKAAELRANGASWEVAARDLGHDPEKLKELATTERPVWRKLLAGAPREVIEDAFAESVLALRTELRTGLRKDACAAANTLTKLWMKLVRHRAGGGKPIECKKMHVPPEKEAWWKYAESVAEMSDEELEGLLDHDRQADCKPDDQRDKDDEPPPEGGDPVRQPPGPLPQSPVGGEGNLSPPAPRSETERGELSSEISERNLGAGDVVQLADAAHLIDVDAEVWAGADEAVGIDRLEAVIADKPVDQVDRRGFNGDFKRPICVDRNDRLRFDDAHPRHAPALDDLEA